jgi:hypothetical protein
METSCIHPLDWWRYPPPTDLSFFPTLNNLNSAHMLLNPRFYDLPTLVSQNKTPHPFRQQFLLGKATLSVSRVWGSQILRQSAHGGGKVVSLMHRPPLPQEIFLVLISQRLSRPEGMKISDIIGNRSRDLPVCSAVPQPQCATACPRSSYYPPIFSLTRTPHLSQFVTFLGYFTTMLLQHDKDHKHKTGNQLVQDRRVL